MFLMLSRAEPMQMMSELRKETYRLRLLGSRDCAFSLDLAIAFA